MARRAAAAEPQPGGRASDALRTLLIATRNAGKLRELAPLAEAAGFRAVSLDSAGIGPSPAEDALETFDTFEENALAKARHFFHCGGGRAVLAEDSGLEVEALGGAPGVRSKRWSNSAQASEALDAANNALLITSLRGVENRRARYGCVAAVVWALGAVTARGTSSGTILEAPRGANGFGYDPLFFSDTLRMTFAEATREQKASVSHRARAVHAVLAEFVRRAELPVVDPVREDG